MSLPCKTFISFKISTIVSQLIKNALAGEKLPVYGSGANIRDWLHVEDHVRALYLVLKSGKVAESYNILPMDTRTFRLWAKLMHKTSDTLYEDAMIAATAKIHNFSVVTRNVSDFANFDVEIINPFEY